MSHRTAAAWRPSRPAVRRAVRAGACGAPVTPVRAAAGPPAPRPASSLPARWPWLGSGERGRVCGAPWPGVRGHSTLRPRSRSMATVRKSRSASRGRARARPCGQWRRSRVARRLWKTPATRTAHVFQPAHTALRPRPGRSCGVSRVWGPPVFTRVCVACTFVGGSRAAPAPVLLAELPWPPRTVPVALQDGRSQPTARRFPRWLARGWRLQGGRSRGQGGLRPRSPRPLSPDRRF